MLYQDNEYLHTTRHTSEIDEDLEGKKNDTFPILQIFAQSDCHLFLCLKNILEGQMLKIEEQVKTLFFSSKLEDQLQKRHVSEYY